MRSFWNALRFGIKFVDVFNHFDDVLRLVFVSSQRASDYLLKVVSFDDRIYAVKRLNRRLVYVIKVFNQNCSITVLEPYSIGVVSCPYESNAFKVLCLFLCEICHVTCFF